MSEHAPRGGDDLFKVVHLDEAHSALRIEQPLRARERPPSSWVESILTTMACGRAKRGSVSRGLLVEGHRRSARRGFGPSARPSTLDAQDPPPRFESQS
jgi:hypothetical protein